MDFVIRSRPLSRGIGGGHRVALLARDRGDVDDSAVGAFFMPGITARLQKKTPWQLTAKTRSHLRRRRPRCAASRR